MTIISILEVFGATAAALGGYEGVKWAVSRFFPKESEQRQDEATAKQSEVDVEKALRAMFEQERASLRLEYESRLREQREDYTARISELRAANEHQNAQNLALLKDGAHKDKIIDDKTEMIRSLQEKLIEAERRIAWYQRLVMFLRAWHCEREYGSSKEDCRRRKPAQNPPLKYTPIEGADDDGCTEGPQPED